ncbi:two-component regulator propeller domain-containing protein [Chryseolinea sp. T2]|uniref:two-component regulator propeller domain-containing protein n=1 Tax=Chryseolinea sp. T2 TaxID=3129255 RepID=UPI003077B9F7
MRPQLILPAIIVCILHATCTIQREEVATGYFKPPKVVEAKSYKLPPEKTVPPKVVPASGMKKILAGEPETVHIKSNVVSAKPNRVVPAGPPKLILPDGEVFKLPEVVPAIDSPFIAAAPEVILMKDAFVKENSLGSFSSIKAMHGLNSNHISSLCEDKAGNLWIGAWWGGLSKFDGKFLTNYSVVQGMSTNRVSCIFEDDKGNLWIGTLDGGVNKFDGINITHYTTREGLASNNVWTIIQDKNGDMWFGTDRGLNRYDGSSFTHYTAAQGLSDKDILSVFEDSHGNLWAGARGGLFKFDGRSFNSYTSAIGVNDTIEVRSMLEDNEKNIWFATNDKGLFKYDGQYITQFTTESGLSSDRLSGIMKDTHGDIWISTFGNGASKYDGESFTHLSVEQGLAHDLVHSIVEDRRGSIWMATASGVCKYDGKLFNHFVPFNEREVGILMAAKNGTVWIGSANGEFLDKYDGKSVSRYTIREGFPPHVIKNIIEDRNGNMWFGTSGGVTKYDGRYFTHYSKKNGLIDDNVLFQMEDAKGNLWFGTMTGLSKFDGDVFTNYEIASDQGDIGVFSLLEDHQGTIWIGTFAKGVYSFDGTSFTQYDPAHSVSHKMITGIVEDGNNNIWFCTGRGVNKFDRKHFIWYTSEQGLSNNTTTNVLKDRNGNIWIVTIDGLNMIRIEATTANTLENSQLSLFKKYAASEGFSTGGSIFNSIAQDSSGNIWIGATNKVTHYHPEGDLPDTIPPVIRLKNIALFNENINWHEAEKKKDGAIILNNGSRLEHFNFTGFTPWYNQPENLQLNYDNNYLSFQFIGITTYRPREVRYQYFLEGLDKNWSNITDQPEATYNNLPHGKYTFKAKAVNSEGYWSKELQYSFIILPPWWKTWWAYLSYALSFGVMMWMFTWFRSRQLKAENNRLEENIKVRTIELERSLSEKYQLMETVERQEALLKERTRISRELHDDIGSTLGSISIYSEVAKNRAAKKQDTDEVLLKIGHASRELIDKMSDIVWSLNSNNESFEKLQNRMLTFAAMILASRNILFDFTADEELKRIQFTVEQRKNVFLIFKEALHNMVKYSDCKTAWITLSLDNNVLIMVIRDDGKGFDPSQSNTDPAFAVESLGGEGIKNMHARANDLNANLRILSKKNDGTTIYLTLPL